MLVFSLYRAARGLEAGAEPVLPLFQALPYVALLIAMLFFIYAVIGMQVSPAPQGPVCSVVPDLGQLHLCQVEWKANTTAA